MATAYEPQGGTSKKTGKPRVWPQGRQSKVQDMIDNAKNGDGMPKAPDGKPLGSNGPLKKKKSLNAKQRNIVVIIEAFLSEGKRTSEIKAYFRDNPNPEYRLKYRQTQRYIGLAQARMRAAIGTDDNLRAQHYAILMKVVSDKNASPKEITAAIAQANQMLGLNKQVTRVADTNTQGDDIDKDDSALNLRRNRLIRVLGKMRAEEGLGVEETN